MPHTPIKMDVLRKTLRGIESRIYTTIASLDMTAYATKEPVVFAERQSGERLELQAGDKWGERWDCAWFHFRGRVPESAAGRKVVLLIDVNGELCVFDEEGTPVRGLTNVNSEFDLTLGLPGKRVFPFAERAAGGETIDLWADAGNNDLFGFYRSGTVEGSGCRDLPRGDPPIVLRLRSAARLCRAIGEQSARTARIQQALYEVHLLLRHPSDEAVAESRRLLGAELAKRGGDPTMTASAVGHAHIDLAWLWPIRETYRKGARTFATVLRNMEQYPDYVFGASQPQLYQWMKEQHPKLYAQIKQRVAKGAGKRRARCGWNRTRTSSGGRGASPANLYGKRFFRRGVRHGHPDAVGAGHIRIHGGLPQLLKKSGVDYLMTQKLPGACITTHPHHSFLWEGLDGSRVLTHLPPEDTYNSPAAPRSSEDRTGLHGRNVSEARAHAVRHRRRRRRSRRGTPGAARAGAEPGRAPPVVQEPCDRLLPKLETRGGARYKTYHGELYLEKHQGTLTSQARNKR